MLFIRNYCISLLSLFLSLGVYSQAQNVEVDFETSTTWFGFDGGAFSTITNPHQNTLNQSNKVGRLIKGAGKSWAGAYYDVVEPMDFITYNTFSLMVYAHKNNAKLLLKVENKANGSINYTREKTLTKSNEWETLVFDFSQIPSNVYDRITLIFDNGTVGNGSLDFTYYIDDIKLYREGDALPECKSNQTGNSPATSQYELVWADEFDQDGALCHKNWTYDLGTGSQGWGNFEAQSYTNTQDNVYIENGILNIVALKNGNTYTSARIKTQQLFSLQYGKIEIRAKLPTTAGTWPAVWLLGSNNPEVGWPASGEIDIIEQFSNKSVNISTAHWSNNGNHAEYGREATIPNPSGFNTYSLEWTSNKLLTRINNAWAWEMTINSIDAFHKNFFIIMNLALGGNKGAGNIDPTFSQDALEIDYIRVYKNNQGSFTLSHKDFLPKHISVIPNRMGWLISSPNNPINRINLYNLNGQLVGVYEPNTDNYTIKNEHLANNINFVELFYRNQRAVFKLFKSN